MKENVKHNIDEKYELINHMNRVATLSKRMAEYMKIEESVSKEIYIAAHLHDVGKLVMHQSILNKRGIITKQEKEYLNDHVKYSYVASLLFGEKLTEDIIEMIFQHHENYDGTGYPRGLKDCQIHIGAHIIKVCDVYDAIRSDRPYREAMSQQEAFAEMMKEVEKYHPSCLKALEEIEKIPGRLAAI